MKRIKKHIEPRFGDLWNSIKYSNIHAFRDSEEDKRHNSAGNI